MSSVVLIISAYLLGSVPFGFIIGKAHGRDIRSVGSGNIGATNLSRALGKKWGYLCFCLDMLKGLIPMSAAMRFCSSQPSVAELSLSLAIGFAAVLGHVFPVYLKFKGGKGIATSFGVALGLWPYYTLSAGFAFVVWAAVVLVWRYVSLASIAASVAFPVSLIFAILLRAGWDFTNLWPLLTAAVAIPVLVIFRHRANIKRIIAGTEGKVFTRRN